MTAVLFSGLTDDGAPPEFLADVKRRWPFVTTSYLEFLSVTDGAQFDVFVFYGSGTSRYPSVVEENRRRSLYGDLSECVVIAEDAAGDAFLGVSVRPI